MYIAHYESLIVFKECNFFMLIIIIILLLAVLFSHYDWGGGGAIAPIVNFFAPPTTCFEIYCNSLFNALCYTFKLLWQLQMVKR